MRTVVCLVSVVGVLAPVVAASASTATTSNATAPAGTTRPSAAGEYATAVTQICAGALLFDHAHNEGTRADALAIARDIRASTARRLTRVSALPAPPGLASLTARWISTQRRLAAMYAQLWVRIYDTINAANTPAEQATLPGRLEELVHTPDGLKHAASRLELELNVPDCTGGG